RPGARLAGREGAARGLEAARLRAAARALDRPVAHAADRRQAQDHRASARARSHHRDRRCAGGAGAEAPGLMRLQRRIASVLSRGERPFVELVFDDEVVRLSLEEARRARDWMTFAAGWLGSHDALELGGAIEKAMDAIGEQPARVVDDHV